MRRRHKEPSRSGQLDQRYARLARHTDPESAEDDYFRFANRGR